MAFKLCLRADWNARQRRRRRRAHDKGALHSEVYHMRVNAAAVDDEIVEREKRGSDGWI